MAVLFTSFSSSSTGAMSIVNSQSGSKQDGGMTNERVVSDPADESRPIGLGSSAGVGWLSAPCGAKSTVVVVAGAEAEPWLMSPSALWFLSE